VRKAIVIATGIVLLALVDWNIAAREGLLRDGRVVLLELAPVDPRSLMQGDYMALRFRIGNDALTPATGAVPADGRLIVTVGEDGVATFGRFDDGAAPGPNEARLRYRIRDGQMKLATNAFFFEEGRGKEYAPARYGEFRVAPDGDAILTGLRGAKRERLGG